MTPHISWFSHHRKGPLSGNVTTTGYDRDEAQTCRSLSDSQAWRSAEWRHSLGAKIE
jgi:hypothetical protein